MRLKTQLLFLVVILALFSVEESFAKRRGGGSRGGSRSRSSASSRGWYVFFTPYYLYHIKIYMNHINYMIHVYFGTNQAIGIVSNS